MSENDEDLELQALERQLDDAFETTRPRPAFEDELWLRMQSTRPAPSRLRDALAGLWQGIRAVPAVPATATALVLIVAIGVGVVVLNGPGHGGGGASSTAQNREAAAPAAGQSLSGSFGRVPSPMFNNTPKATTPGPSPTTANGVDYAGPVRFVWAGTFDLSITTAPVYRYHEPSASEADQFAASLGAVLRERPTGFLGSYSTSDYTLKVRGTVASPPSSPAYFIFSGLNLPPVDAAGGPQAVADVFLAEHSLQPPWPYTASVDSSGDPIKVVYERQFVVPGYGPANLLNSNANRYGVEVDLSGNRPVLASGVLPVSMDVANYKIVSTAEAIQAAVSSPSVSSPAGAAPSSASPLPPVRLDHAELVYVLVPAGDNSFYEPAVLFTGTLDVGGKSYTRYVLVSAIDPSQRTP